jgi:hypothetical protein
MNPPVYLTYYILLTITLASSVMLFGLHKALENAGWPRAERRTAVGAFSSVLIGWYLAALLLSWTGVYAGFKDRFPTIQYGIFVPVIVGVILMARSTLVARVIDATPQHWLIGIQVVRLIGAIFLVLYATGHIPGFFAWPAGIGDVLVGVLAPVVAIAYARSPERNSDLVFAWNLFGLLDFVVAISTGFLSSPLPFQLAAFDLPNELITRFPLVLIPVFGVPVCILLHFASLIKLRKATKGDWLRVGLLN